jgi:hypothetical protein
MNIERKVPQSRSGSELCCRTLSRIEAMVKLKNKIREVIVIALDDGGRIHRILSTSGKRRMASSWLLYLFKIQRKLEYFRITVSEAAGLYK